MEGRCDIEGRAEEPAEWKRMGDWGTGGSGTSGDGPSVSGATVVRDARRLEMTALEAGLTRTSFGEESFGGRREEEVEGACRPRASTLAADAEEE